jgi:hypothetical protein
MRSLVTSPIPSIISDVPVTETVQFQATPGFRRELESSAAKLNLSVSAYILYLHSRTRQGDNTARLDRHVKEVFGKHGDLIRRLAK